MSFYDQLLPLHDPSEAQQQQRSFYSGYNPEEVAQLAQFKFKDFSSTIHTQALQPEKKEPL